MEHFYEEGKKYELKDFRVLTSGILRSVLKPEDVVEDILKDECVKCKRSVSQYYPYYSQENDPEIEQLKMEFEVTSKKWVQIVISVSIVLGFGKFQIQYNLQTLLYRITIQTHTDTTINHYSGLQ